MSEGKKPQSFDEYFASDDKLLKGPCVAMTYRTVKGVKQFRCGMYLGMKKIDKSSAEHMARTLGFGCGCTSSKGNPDPLSRALAREVGERMMKRYAKKFAKQKEG